MIIYGIIVLVQSKRLAALTQIKAVSNLVLDRISREQGAEDCISRHNFLLHSSNLLTTDDRLETGYGNYFTDVTRLRKQR